MSRDFDDRDDRDDRDRDDRDDRPRRRDDHDRDFDDRPDPRTVARRKAKPAAIALLVVGILSLLWGGWNFAQYTVMAEATEAEFNRQRDKALSDPQYQNNEAAKKQMTEVMDMTWKVSKVILPVGFGLEMLLALITIFGSTKMMSLSSRGWSVAAAVAAMIPHTGCIVWAVSLAFGIWALVVLNSKEVKRAFAVGKAPPDDDYDDRDRGR